MKGRARTLAVVLAVVGISAAAVVGATATTNRSESKRAIAHAKPPGPTNCGLRHNVKHVVYLIFDNVHFLRDNPNVPSDLEVKTVTWWPRAVRPSAVLWTTRSTPKPRSMRSVRKPIRRPGVAEAVTGRKTPAVYSSPLVCCPLGGAEQAGSAAAERTLRSG